MENSKYNLFSKEFEPDEVANCKDLPVNEENLNSKYDNIMTIADYYNNYASLKNLYGFTMKINKMVQPTVKDYAGVLDTLHKYGDIIDFVFEDYKKDGKTRTKLHIHGIIRFGRKNPLFRKMVPKGVHFKCEQISDYENWHTYIHKNDKKENLC